MKETEEKILKYSLSELIKLCGDKFKRVGLIYGTWEACTEGWCTLGKTPEEAVARLIISLNQQYEKTEEHKIR